MRFAVIYTIENFVVGITIDFDHVELFFNVGEKIRVLVSRPYLVGYRWNGDNPRAGTAYNEIKVVRGREIRHDGCVEHYRRVGLPVGTVRFVVEPCYVLIGIFAEGDSRFPPGIVDRLWSQTDLNAGLLEHVNHGRPIDSSE
jgi:hypothetical protein